MSTDIEIIEKLIVDAVKDQGCSLYHFEKKGNRLFVYVEKRGGASLRDCHEISKNLSLSLSAARDTWRDMLLDVSTPGIERYLYKSEHFRGAKGERVQVKIAGEILEGRLVEVNEEGITVKLTSGVGRRFTYNEILSAQVKRNTEELFKRR